MTFPLAETFSRSTPLMYTEMFPVGTTLSLIPIIVTFARILSPTKTSEMFKLNVGLCFNTMNVYESAVTLV